LLAWLTLLAGGIDALGRRRRHRKLRALAAQWRMTYSADDRLRLADKVADRFPIPGAADVHVNDVIYGADKDAYRYVFTAEFTIGVVRTKHRRVRVASFTEPRDRDSVDSAGPLVLAPDRLSLLEQYRHLAPLTTRISETEFG